MADQPAWLALELKVQRVALKVAVTVGPPCGAAAEVALQQAPAVVWVGCRAAAEAQPSAWMEEVALVALTLVGAHRAEHQGVSSQAACRTSCHEVVLLLPHHPHPHTLCHASLLRRDSLLSQGSMQVPSRHTPPRCQLQLDRDVCADC